MWIMTPFGILMPAAIPAEVREALAATGHPDWDMQVRTRDKRALTHLRKMYMGGEDMLGPTIATPAMDYDYRAYCDADDFANAVHAMVTEIDYEKFKPETERFGKMGRDLHVLYNRIWGVVFTHYERRPPRRGRALTRRNWWDDV